MKAELDADYERAGFGGALKPGNSPALLIVDLVMAYLDPQSPLYAGVPEILAANEALLAAARTAEVPVILTNVCYRPDGVDGGLFFRKVPALAAFQEGAPMGAFPPSLAPTPADIVLTKKYPSAFFGTPLAAMLTARGIDTLFITGFSTSGCVRATALDALCHGFVPLVVEQACGDRSPEVQAANLFDIQAKIGQVVDLQSALALLSAKGAPLRT